jgi:hypothetical protein
MSANKTSAVAADEPVDVLFALQDKFDLLDFAGPVEAFTSALHNFKDECKTPSLLVCAELYPSVLSMAITLLTCWCRQQLPKPLRSPSPPLSPR